MTVLDEVWMVVNQDPTKGIIYSAPAENAQLAWLNAIHRYCYPPMTKKELMTQGWRAKKVKVVLEGE